MKSFQKKRGFKNILHSRPVLGFFGILLFFSVFGMIGFFGKMQVTRENREIIENKVMELEKKKEKLSSDINKLETNAGVEESIRDKFGLVKEGENVIVVVEEKNQSEEKEASKKSFFSPLFFWKNWFK